MKFALVYVIILAGIILTCEVNRIKLKAGNRTIDGTQAYIIIWGFVLIALVALRAEAVGHDTSMYEIIYQRAFNNNSLGDFISNYGYTEYAYYFVEYIVSKLGNYRLFLAVMAVISVAPTIFVIYRYSENRVLSLILYVCFPYYTFCMSGMRQAAAMGCIMLAYHCIKKKKLVPYIILCVIAMLFHSSALLFFPVYWIDKIPYKKLTRVVAVIIMVAAYVLRRSLWEIATMFARQQHSSNEAGGQMMYLFMVLSVVLGYYYKKEFVEKKNESSNKVLLYLQILSVALWPIASINSATFRMYYYYHMFIVLFVPSLISSINKRIEKLIVISGYLFVSIFFIVTQILPVSQGFNPYMFFWQ